MSLPGPVPVPVVFDVNVLVLAIAALDRPPCDHELCGLRRIGSLSPASLVPAREELSPVRSCGNGSRRQRG